MRLLAGLFALAGWLAATAALVVAAPDLAADRPEAAAPVLAVHLVGLALLAPAVTGASFHLLPVMLRNELRGGRSLLLVPLFLSAGVALAAAVAVDAKYVLWPAAAVLSLGLAIVAAELTRLVLRAPRQRTLVASQVGVALSLAHAVAAFALGALVFAHGDPPLAEVTHARWLLVHLHVAVLGWLTLLIVGVGRNLVPMLAQAPAPRPRRLPLEELTLAVGLWILAAGIAAASRALELAGGALVISALALFFAVLVRSARARHGPLEAPLVHMLAGLGFLAQAAVLGVGIAAGALAPRRALVAYVVFLLLGWAAGVVLGHIGKLLSLSLWVWWPPGPRPKQAALYPRSLWLAEAATFVVGVEAAAVGTLVGSVPAIRAGAALLCLAAMAAAVAAMRTWSRRPQER